MRRLAVLCLICACSKGPSLVIPADRPILGWSTAPDEKPAGFTQPDEHRCAADPTRVYVGELFVNGIDDVQVDWHWAPVLPGPNAALPTLAQPELSLAGTLAGANESTDDVLADHPFGPDVNADVLLDPGFGFLLFEGEGRTPSTLHTEVENRSFPRAQLGFTPQAGDRTLMRGAWILDCGHPPYGAELHPPSFLTFARQEDARTTTAVALYEPYRSSLLFNPDPAFAAAFNSTTRFTAQGTKSFPHALFDSVLEAVAAGEQHLSAHGLMEANRFDTLDFLVCAPLPRPAGAQLSATWRFTARSGVSLRTEVNDSAGCVRFVFSMDKSYAPKALPYQSAEWPWTELSDSASGQLGHSIDVRQAIIDALKSRGIDASTAPSLQPDHAPLIDAYPPLLPRAGADEDAPTAVEAAADDQPFPFYGRARVTWK